MTKSAKRGAFSGQTVVEESVALTWHAAATAAVAEEADVILVTTGRHKLIESVASATRNFKT
jgi:hypothetical protein